MPVCELDHIVVGASSLEAGARFIHDRLGVEIPMGGKHERMGTHNAIMQLGGAAYLEVIAIDEDAPAPERPRWYALDDPAMRARLAEGPSVITWVVRVADIVTTVQAAPVHLGAVEPFTRGDLTWRLTVPEDGHLPGGGVIPHVIEWNRGLRPWEEMADPGCRLAELVLTHPDADRIGEALRALCGAESEKATVRRGALPGLTARIATPSGEVVSL